MSLVGERGCTLGGFVCEKVEAGVEGRQEDYVFIG